MARLSLSVRYGTFEIDHLATEVTFGSVPHLPGLHIEGLRLDVQLVQRPRRQADEHLLPTPHVSFLRGVGEHSVLPFLAITSGSKRDSLRKFLANVVPFVAREPGVMAIRTQVLGIDTILINGIPDVVHEIFVVAVRWLVVTIVCGQTSPASSKASSTISGVGEFR